MMKKILALAATALFSVNASAGFIQYNLEDERLSGYFVQNEEDRSIAYYAFFVRAENYYNAFTPLEGFQNLSWVRSRYDNTGPTIFQVYNLVEGRDVLYLTLDFSSTGTPGLYSFTSSFLRVPTPDDATSVPVTPLAYYFHGTARASAPYPEILDYIEWARANEGGYPEHLDYLIPTPNVIPEPSTLALLAFGATGLAGAMRRRRPAPTAAGQGLAPTSGRGSKPVPSCCGAAQYRRT